MWCITVAYPCFFGLEFKLSFHSQKTLGILSNDPIHHLDLLFRISGTNDNTGHGNARHRDHALAAGPDHPDRLSNWNLYTG